MSGPSTIWLDMQLPGSICGWVTERCGLPCVHLHAMGMDRAGDAEVFERAREAKAVVMTKDSDFARLLDEQGPPPAVIWLRCGNCTTGLLRRLLAESLERSIELVRSGEALVEIVALPLDESEGA